MEARKKKHVGARSLSPLLPTHTLLVQPRAQAECVVREKALVVERVAEELGGRVRGERARVRVRVADGGGREHFVERHAVRLKAGGRDEDLV